MIIIEGPRNSGKKTLASKLALQFDLPIYDYGQQLKAVGHVKMIDIANDLRVWTNKPVGVYITHPLINEYIYGPLLRKKGMVDFYTSEVRPIIQRFISSSIIIYCRTLVSDPALPYFDLLFRTPLTNFRVWEYNYQDDTEAQSLITPLNDYLTKARLATHHKKIGRRFNGNVTL